MPRFPKWDDYMLFLLGMSLGLGLAALFFGALVIAKWTVGLL